MLNSAAPNLIREADSSRDGFVAQWQEGETYDTPAEKQEGRAC